MKKVLFKFIPLLLLSVVSINQAWAWGGMVQGCLRYSTGSENTVCQTNTTTNTTELNTVSSLDITGIWIKNWTNNNNGDGTTISGTQLVYRLYDATNSSEGDKQYRTATNTGTYSGNDREDNWTGTITPTTNSGEYYLKYYYETWFGGKTYPSNQYLPGNESYSQLHYKIRPPEVNGGDFTVSASNEVGSAEGTSDDPFVISNGSTTQFTVTASKSHTDANSKLRVSFNNGTNWSDAANATATTVTSGAITPYSDVRSITIKVKFYNSRASLESATTLSKTIYYKEQPAGITLSAGSHGKVSKDNTNWTSSNTTITGISFNTNYNIYAKGDDHYDFSEWTKGTNSSNTTLGSSTTANTTVRVSSGAVTTVTANFVEHPYTISIVGGTAASTTAKVVTTGTATSKAPVGKYFTSWSVPASNFTLVGCTTNSDPITFNATANGTVTANFGQKYAFIEGRFHVWNVERSGDWTNTFSSGDWDENSTRIKFDYDETNHRFYLHTYAKPKELSTTISNYNPYFYIKTSRASNNVTSSPISYMCTSSQTLTAAGSENGKTLSNSSGSNNNLRFNSIDESGYAVIYFNESKVWYEMEQRLKYDGNGSTSGSVASSYHARNTNATAAANGFSKTGHDFTGWKTGASSGTSYAVGASVPISSSDVTLYAQWSPSTYTVSYNPASPSNFAYTEKPTSGTYNSTVSVTVTPSLNYKITNYSAYKTSASGTSVSVSHSTGTNVYTFTQPAYAVTFKITAAAYGLAATATPSYENKTFSLGYTTTHSPEGTKGTNWFVYYTCTSKPDGATCTIDQSTGVATVSKDGSYTFKVQYRIASGGEGTLLAESDGTTATMKSIPDRSGLTINHARYNTTYMSGDGASATPYFIYLYRVTTYGKLNLTATLPAALASGETLYYSVNGTEKGAVTVDGTAASVTMDLPNKTVGAGRTAAIRFYSKLDNQAPSDAKKALATVYYTVSANPVVTVTATYNGTPIVSQQIPQNADIEVSASVTNISGTPTFTYKKEEGGTYTSTTTYTMDIQGNNVVYAKTTYLGDDWVGSKTITTYAANAVTLTTRKTDMYGDDISMSVTHLFKNTGEEYTAPDIDGYTFSDWACSNSNVQVSDNSGSTWKSTSTNQTVYVKATAAGGTLTAHYTEKKRIYFDNSKAKWTGDIYVYFFNGDSWYNNYNSTDDNGPGVVPRINRIGYGQMTRIGESDIYYYEYGALSFTRVAFSVGNQYNYGHLYDTKGAWRTDFKECNPCYVAPESSDQTKYDHGNNKPTYYYNNGYWRRYMPQKSGYTLHFADKEVAFLPEDPSVDTENFKVTVLRAAGTNYPIYVNNSCMSKTWKNSSTITKDNCSNLTLTQTSGTCNFTTTAEGDYVFHLSTANGTVKLTVEYPLSQGDYQVYYTDNTGKNNNYSNYIRKNTGSVAKNDTVSFFVKKNSSPTYQIKRCTGFSGSTPTWGNVGSAVSISVAKDSVYNFVFQQPAGGASISILKQEYYSGDYYIRTDGAAGGWQNYLSNPDNKMKHTDKASALAAGYNYYYLRWIGDANGNSTANVKFCIATDYNNCVSQEYGNDPAGGSFPGKQALTGKGANVRFTYHPGTNNMTRSCIGGSAHDPQYLVISGTNLQTSSGGDWTGKAAMADQNDWIYTYELKAANNATITLESHYNNEYVTILKPETVLVVNNDDYYDLRVIYDYKTNEVVAAYLPGTVNEDLEVDVDIMFIRYAKDNHEEAPPTTLNLVGGHKITGQEKTLYGAIEFEKDYVRGEGSYSGLASNRPIRSTYWISFPFDVRIKDIFGLGNYTETWIIQRYRGDLRAQKGWFLETKTFWEYILDENYVMKAGEGYALSIDCEAIQWPNNRTTQYLYFPSKDKVKIIDNVLPQSSTNVTEHKCTITSPADRTIKDSHWNVIGIPGFTTGWGKATETVQTIDGDFHYFYTWNPVGNVVTSASAKKYNFQFMHSYMVQYHGNIDWTVAEPAAIPARRSSNAKPEEVEFCLNLMQGDVKVDNAFITLMDNDKISTDFDMNADLVKMFNSKIANVYTIIGDVEVAANCLPMTDQSTIVPVGVQIPADGEYTFSMPNGTSGVGVTLIDGVTGERTNLALTDYTVSLEKGTYDQRFVLEISPIEHTTTAIEISEKTDAPNNVCKKLIDGVLYIIKDGKVFDARGARLQ